MSMPVLGKPGAYTGPRTGQLGLQLQAQVFDVRRGYQRSTGRLASRNRLIAPLEPHARSASSRWKCSARHVRAILDKCIGLAPALGARDSDRNEHVRFWPEAVATLIEQANGSSCKQITGRHVEGSVSPTIRICRAVVYTSLRAPAARTAFAQSPPVRPIPCLYPSTPKGTLLRNRPAN